MIIVSEQQTFAKLRLAPKDFVKMLDENPEEAERWIQQLQLERATPTERKKKEKDPNAPTSRRGRKPQTTLDLTKFA